MYGLSTPTASSAAKGNNLYIENMPKMDMSSLNSLCEIKFTVGWNKWQYIRYWQWHARGLAAFQ